MFRVSNSLVGLLNIVTMVCAIAIILSSLLLGINSSSDCQRFMHFPLLVLGIFMLVLSVLGLVGACCGVSMFLCIYLFVMFLMIITLFCFSIFAFVVTNKGAGEMISGRSYTEYRLGDYSHWLQNQVRNEHNWLKIKSCLHEAHVCQSLGRDFYDGAAEFYMQHLNPIQSGCCKPPTFCGFTYVNATFWTPPKNTVSFDSDCQTWSNNQESLCYDCKSCKAGVLAILKNDWRKLALINICVLIVLNIIYSIGCCAFNNARRDSRYHRYRPYYY
ncbi:hypothetical protein AAC387_Pa05g1467 [Persea americana]